MSSKYDALYKDNPNALGEPFAEFVEFFSKLDAANLHVLDIGCGQGRDAIFIARLGHKVTGVDLSPHGIAQLNAASQAQNLAIKGVVADITEYNTPEEEYDIVLIDRTLHMLAKSERLACLQKLASAVRDGGWLLIADEASNLPDFRQALEISPENWRIENHKKGFLFARRS